MRRSYVRLVISSVLLAWALGIAVLILYALGQSWVDERAHGDGVFLAFELLDQTPASMRGARLRELQQHFSVDLTLLSRREVERRLDRQVRPGERIPYKPLVREEWYFLVFHDGQAVLAAGPVNPAIPAGAFPIGLVLMLVFMPVVAAVVVRRVERGLSKVERANQALAVGELSARVDGQRGAPDELAASFNAMAERVEQLVRSREELLQAVSHELGSPLSRLRFHMELLADQPVDRRQDRLHAMSRELDALDELVSELLGYVQSDDLRVDTQTFDARQGLADLAELARLEAPQGNAVEVTVEIPGGAESRSQAPHWVGRKSRPCGRPVGDVNDMHPSWRVPVPRPAPEDPERQLRSSVGDEVRAEARSPGRRSGGVGCRCVLRDNDYCRSNRRWTWVRELEAVGQLAEATRRTPECRGSERAARLRSCGASARQEASEGWWTWRPRVGTARNSGFDSSTGFSAWSRQRSDPLATVRDTSAERRRHGPTP